MNGISLSRQALARCAVALGLGAAGVGHAIAGCGLSGPLAIPPANWSMSQAGGLLGAVYRPGAERFLPVADDDQRNSSIVGMWRITLVSDGTAYPAYIPPGAVVDFGTQQWHSDGTEFLISGGRAPSTGDVCMGVWESVGHRTYKLKHIALAYASSDTPASQGGPVVPAAYVGPGIIRQLVTVSASGKTFEGTFTIDQYAQDEVTLLQHVAGKIVGTRVTVD
jgi:predicted small lipoprotein YifL